MKELLFNLHDIFLFVIIYTCLLFATFSVFATKHLLYPRLFFSAFLLSQAASSLYALALWGDGFHPWVVVNAPWAFEVLELALWLEAPLLLAYVTHSLYKPSKITAKALIYLLPITLYLITLLLVHLVLQPAQDVAFLKFLRSDIAQYYEHVRNIIRLAFGVAAYLVLHNHQRKINFAYSNLDTLSFRWLKFLVGAYVLLKLWVTLYVVIYTFVFTVFGGDYINLSYFDLMGSMGDYGHLILVSLVLYFGTANARNESQINEESLNEVQISTAENEQDTRPSYTEEQIQRLKNHMQRKQPYLDCNLKIEDLANQVSIPVKTLSNIINREFSKNYFEFINDYRIAEVKTLLSDSNKQTQSIIDLAFAAGYNSKSTFNRLFKTATGLTPTQFRVKQLNETNPTATST